MPIKLPDLDNRTFEDLMQEMIASIPKFSKKWTNFNPSDPGITILELLAWLSEGLIYRINRIPEASYLNFLKLIAGSGEIYDDTDKAHEKIRLYLDEIENGTRTIDMQAMKAVAQEFLKSLYRAISADDFAQLAIEASPEIVKRVAIFPSMYGVSVVIIPDPQIKDNTDLMEATIASVRDYLDRRRLLGTIIDVQLAAYTDIHLMVEITCESYAQSQIFGNTARYAPKGDTTATVVPFDDINSDFVEGAIAWAIISYLDSIVGGPEKQGWPYDRDLIIYELLSVVETIEPVKYVSRIMEFLFSISPFTEDLLPDDQDSHAVNNSLRQIFGQNGYPLPKEATIAAEQDQWAISTAETTYLIEQDGTKLDVYRSFKRIPVKGLINLKGLDIRIEDIGNE